MSVVVLREDRANKTFESAKTWISNLNGTLEIIDESDVVIGEFPHGSWVGVYTDGS